MISFLKKADSEKGKLFSFRRFWKKGIFPISDDFGKNHWKKGYFPFSEKLEIGLI